MRFAKRKTVAERRADCERLTAERERIDAGNRLLPVRPYRDAYRPAATHWGFKAGMVKTSDQVWRLAYVTVQSFGGRDWQGSCYSTTLAHFERLADGWKYRGVIYQSLLRAVRAYYTTEERANRLKYLRPPGQEG